MQEARRRPARRNPREVHAAGRAARLSPRTSGLGEIQITDVPRRCEPGTGEYDPPRGVRLRRRRAGAGQRAGAGYPILNFLIERYREAFNAEVDHFVDCVANGNKPLAGFAEGREALRLADAALESLLTGTGICLDR